MYARLAMCAPTARNAASNWPSTLRLGRFVTFALSSSVDAQVDDALDLGVEHVARQPVLGDAEAHHAACHRPRLADRHAVAERAR